MRQIIFSTLFCVCAFNVLGQVVEASVKLGDIGQIRLTKVKFDPKANVIEYSKQNHPIAINGQPFFGTLEGLPKQELKKLILAIGLVKYDLEVTGMFDPWIEEDIYQPRFSLKKYGDGYRLTGSFSDGAGAYAAEWRVIGKSSIRTILSNDEYITIGYLDKR